jgi:hypothetical protein
VAGLIRHAVLTVWELRAMYRRAGDRRMPYRQLLLATARWLVPITRVRQRFLFSLTTLTFHVAIIVVPLLLAGHIALVEASVGLAWPAIGDRVADGLTLAAIAAALLLVVQRAAARDTRALSRFQDYALPLIVAVPFASGFLLMHPAWNPIPHQATMLTHALSADVLLVLMPLTKLSHMVLLPATQAVSELAWHFPADAGRLVGVALGREDQPI